MDILSQQGNRVVTVDITVIRKDGTIEKITPINVVAK